LEDAAAQIVEVPAGLAEEAMEGAEVFELGELGGLNNAGKGTAPGTEDPGAGQSPEGTETGLCEAGLEGEQEWSKGTDQEMGHKEWQSFTSHMKDKQLKKSASALFAFFQQVLIDA
jgi:hypothetical protein